MRVVPTSAWLLLAAAAVLLLVPPRAPAAEPSNPNDPCSNAGRNTCGTLGAGFYDESRYGIRWYGDFRGAVAGDLPTFCLDSRFWYASPAYKYRQAPAGRLLNRDEEVVSVERQQKIAYALWTYGRSTKPNQQAAVALYVHSLVGDIRPGEVDPAAVNPRVAAVFTKVAAAAARLHGPYTVETRLPEQPAVGKPVRATLRVLSAAGHALPNVRLTLVAEGPITAPAEARTGPDGVAVVRLTPRGAGESRLRIESAPVASTLPTIFRATTRAAAPNAQRLAAPASERVTAAASVSVRATPELRGAISTQVARGGARIFDRIRVSGLGSTTAQIDLQLFGPFATRSAIRCAGRPHWTGSLIAKGDAQLRSKAVTLARPGFYAYRAHLIGSSHVAAFTTECRLRAQTALVAPRILTGGAAVAAEVTATGARSSKPVRVRVPTLDIDAAVLPIGIDLKSGALGTPKSVRQAGWWQDGRAPGSTSGTILIAGHVDSARDGRGVFFSLRNARVGAKVQLRAANGRTFTYRVTSVRSHHKNALPTGIYSRAGAPRLVLVTCGGSFDRATGQYRNNVVVTAVPD